MTCSGMSSGGEGAFRRRAVSSANLLLEAADMLENQGAHSSQSERTNSSTGDTRLAPAASTHPAAIQAASTRPASIQAASTRPASIQAFHSSSSSVASPSFELRSLFNWKRKSKRRANGGGPSKKVKVRTWTHTWVCMGRMSDDSVPDASERAALKLAGLGERRFALDITLSAQELMYHLEAQFPKLIDSGGFELMRAEEGGSRELQSIEMPSGGYTCEYLKAVVHSAKVYIRPLQTDLNMDPCSPEVTLHVDNNLPYSVLISPQKRCAVNASA